MKPQELFDALERGDRVEYKVGLYEWEKWTGTAWHQDKIYRIVKSEPKLVPHWPAIFKSEQKYYFTNTLYSSEIIATQRLENFVRLATEYPPIMLEVKE